MKGESKMSQALGDRRGFTLTELMVVVAIIVLLTSLVIPNLAGRLTKARMHAAEDQIAEIESALANYHADFGTYPGDVFPSEDLNNNGILDWYDADNDGVIDPGESEDEGVDVDMDGTKDYALVSNGRLDQGDGVVNIDDLEWALKTTAKNGPYMEEIPLDPWDNRYVYYAPFKRSYNAADFLYINPKAASSIRNEDGVVTLNGRLDGNKVPRDGVFTEDAGIGQYATSQVAPNVDASFVGKWAGRDNGILDHGDDDNKNGTIEYYDYVAQALPAPQQDQDLELGNADVSPDGLARNLGYYIYSTGRNKTDETMTGCEDIGGLGGAGNPDNILNEIGPPDMRLYVESPPSAASRFDEDLDGDSRLDTGYEDTGIDGMPGTKDRGEDDWDNPNVTNPTVTLPDPTGQPDEEFGTTSGGPSTWHYNTHHDAANPNTRGFDIGGDDVNSWNKKRPWREHSSYGG
jgi:general secretion pathway protein G